MNQTSAASEISAQVAHIRAADERVITIVDDDVAICVLRIEPSVAERVLIDQGHRDAVSLHRQAGERALAPAMRAAVERTTGRVVTKVEADCHLDPDITVVTFTFAPPLTTLSAGSASAGTIVH